MHVNGIWKGFNMRRRIVAFLLVSVLLALHLSISVFALGNDAMDNRIKDMLSCYHESGVLDIQFHLSVPAEEQYAIANEIYGSYEFTSLPECGFYSGYVGEEELPHLLRELLSKEEVRYAFPNFYLPASDFSPSYGVSSLGYYDADTTEWALEAVGAYAGWEMGFTASNSITIAVLDSGLSSGNAQHDDMLNIDWTNAYNFTAQGLSSDLTDYASHGTFIVGQLAACLNEYGVNGICPGVTILPIKVAIGYYNSKAYASLSDALNGLNYAQQKGAKIVNFSYDMSYSEYYDITQNTYKGIFVTSAGNNSMDIASDSDNCAKINSLNNWIVVGAVDSSMQMASISNYSSTYVDVFAPGVDIASFSRDSVSGLKTGSGTSFAAPYVAGIAAIVAAKCPDKSRSSIINLLLSQVSSQSSLSGYCVSGGVVNLENIASYLYSETRPAYAVGDVNGDGAVTGADYLLIKKHVLGTISLTGSALAAADVNNDSTVSAQDYIYTNRFVLQTAYFPVSWTVADWSTESVT